MKSRDVYPKYLKWHCAKTGQNAKKAPFAASKTSRTITGDLSGIIAIILVSYVILTSIFIYNLGVPPNYLGPVMVGLISVGGALLWWRGGAFLYARNTILVITAMLIGRLFLRIMDHNLLPVGVALHEQTLANCARKAKTRITSGFARCLIFDSFRSDWGRAIYFDPGDGCKMTGRDLMQVDNYLPPGSILLYVENSVSIRKLSNHICILQYSSEYSSYPYGYRKVI